nr:hypothetical protein [Mycobacterium sp. QGD 101]
MGSGFACGVTGIDFLECGVDVIRIEHDACNDSIVRVGFEDDESFGVEPFGSLVASRQAGTTERKALSPGRNCGRRNVLSADLGDRLNARDFDISSASGSGVHRPPAIVHVGIVRQYLRHCGPVAGCEVRRKAVECPRGRVLQLRCWRTEFVEPDERGVEAILVEQLGAAEHIAFHCQEVDFPPLSFEAMVRDPLCHIGDYGAEVAEPMHSRDVDLGVRRVVPCGLDIREKFARCESCSATVVDVHPVRSRHGELAPVERGVDFRDYGPRVRVRCGIAGKVPRVEFLEGGVDVARVQHDGRCDSVVGVNFNDV